MRLVRSAAVLMVVAAGLSCGRRDGDPPPAADRAEPPVGVVTPPARDVPQEPVKTYAAPDAKTIADYQAMGGTYGSFIPNSTRTLGYTGFADTDFREGSPVRGALPGFLFKVGTPYRSGPLPDAPVDFGLAFQFAGGFFDEFGSADNLQHLRFLNLSLVRPDQKCARRYDEFLKKFKGLKNLTSLQIMVTDQGLGELGGFANLTDLAVGGPHITDGGLMALKGVKNLRSLSLDMYPDAITKNGIREMEGIATLTHLRVAALVPHRTSSFG